MRDPKLAHILFPFKKGFKKLRTPEQMNVSRFA